MPRLNSNEKHRKVGVSILFQRDDIANQPAFNLGVLNAPPNFSSDTNPVESYDERGGASVLDEYEVTRMKEQATLQIRNQEGSILHMVFGAATPGTYTQNNTAVVNQSVTAAKGKDIFLFAPSGHPNAGERMYNVGSFSARGPSGTPSSYPALQGNGQPNYVLDAVKGTVFIPTVSAIPDGAFEVSYTPGTITAKGEILPQTLIQGVTGIMEFWEVAASGAVQIVRRSRVRVSTKGARTLGTQNDNYAELDVTILTDSLSAKPAGYLRDITANAF